MFLLTAHVFMVLCGCRWVMVPPIGTRNVFEDRKRAVEDRMSDQNEQGTSTEQVEGQEPTTQPQEQVPVQEPDQQEVADNSDGQQPEQTAEDTTQEVDPRISKANREAANYRSRLREQEKANKDLEDKLNGILQGLGKLSGHVPEDGEQVDPEEAITAATQRAEQAEAKARALHVTSDLRDEASKAGLNPRLLIPLLKGEGKLDNLDPEADDYTSQVGAVIAEAQENYPELKAPAAPRSSGQAPTPTDNGDGGKLTREDLARMTSAEINKAAAEGKLNHLMNQ